MLMSQTFTNFHPYLTESLPLPIYNNKDISEVRDIIMKTNQAKYKFREAGSYLNQSLLNLKAPGNSDDNRNEYPIYIKGTTYNNYNDEAF